MNVTCIRDFRPISFFVSFAMVIAMAVIFRLALEEVKLLQKQRERKLGIPALHTAPQHSPTGPGGALRRTTSGGGGGGGGVGDKGDGDGGKEDLVLQDTFAQETAVTIEDPNMYAIVLSKSHSLSIQFCEDSTEWRLWFLL